MKETLAGLAAKTGFSITTISRVLSGKADQHRISPETREKNLDSSQGKQLFSKSCCAKSQDKPHKHHRPDAAFRSEPLLCRHC